jgi:hypothetical protein
MKALAVVAACFFAASTAVIAQAPQGGAKKGRVDCSQAKDPKACEERVAKGKAAAEKARKLCEGKEGAAHRDCMRSAMCAQSKDPAGCEAKAKEVRQKVDAERARIREACKGKEGEALRACVREQRGGKK